MILPYKSGICRVTSIYGLRTDPNTHENNVFHFGIDFQGESSERGMANEIISVNNGTVVKVCLAESSRNPDWAMGNFMVIRGDDGVIVRYAHLSTIHYKKGERVSIGDVIGTEGSTGTTTKRHLHLECSRGEYHINPAEYLGVYNKKGIVSVLSDQERSKLRQKDYPIRKRSTVTILHGATFQNGEPVPTQLIHGRYHVLTIREWCALLEGIDEPIWLCYLRKARI